MSKKVALISGITGQDGSFLAEFLIEKGYEVHGILRRSSSFNTARIEHLYLDEWVRDMKQNRLVNLHWGDMTDSSSLIRIIQSVQPDEIYNLAAQSHVKVSFDVPEYTAAVSSLFRQVLCRSSECCRLNPIKPNQYRFPVIYQRSDLLYTLCRLPPDLSAYFSEQ